MIRSDAAVDGPVRFARFAFPPNLLGFCGPGSEDDLAAYATGRSDPGLRELAGQFEGAYPYLELLAAANHRADPLDPEVVEAYWIGNELLPRVPVHDFGLSIDDRFRRRAGSDWRRVSDAIPAGLAHHSFHVLRVMPWVGLIRQGVVDEPLSIVDRCRVSWGEVVGQADPRSPGAGWLVRRSPLRWSGSRLTWGEPRVDVVSAPFEVAPGDVVAVHWDWICERLAPGQLRWLRATTLSQLADLHAG